MDQISMRDEGEDGAAGRAIEEEAAWAARLDDEGGAAGRTIVASRAPEGRRFDFLYRQLQADFIRFEALAFMHLREASEDYQGGMWNFFTLSNGGFYMAPVEPSSFRLCCPGNHYEGTLSADAAGIFACAMALSHLSYSATTDRPGRLFCLLRAFYDEHPEAAALNRALD